MLSATPPRPLCRRSELVHDWKARLGCDVGEGVGRSQSVIVVRDDLGVLEIFANQFESKAETAHKICGLAQKWQIGDWMGPPTLRYQGLDGATHSPVPRKCGWPLVCQLLGAFCLVAGLALDIWAVATFRRVGTTRHPARPTTALAIGDPYRFTRNPMYLGLVFITAGSGTPG